MNALELETPFRGIEPELTQVGDERRGSARSIHVWWARPRCRDETDLRHENALLMRLTEEDNVRYEHVEQRRTVRAWPAHVKARIVADADHIDIGLPIDLAGAQKKPVETSLRGEIEQISEAAEAAE